MIMDSGGMGKAKKGLISKTWKRCKSLSFRKAPPLHKSKSWLAEGCFSIYVGPERERFVIKTEYVNHPLFKTLLEQAESEYGYSSDGPLLLPCEVHHFLETLAEMEDRNGCRSFVGRGRSHSSYLYHLLTPPRSSSNISL